MRLVFWQLFGSPHQAAFVRELARILGVESVVCAFCAELEQALRRQGWEEPDYGAATVLRVGDAEDVELVMQSVGADAIHIFSSLYHA